MEQVRQAFMHPVKHARGRSTALDCALALARTPALASGMRSQPLPGGVNGLLCLVAGEPGALDEAIKASGMPGADVMAAAELYIQQVMLHSKADSFRILGVASPCERTTARAHMRLLMTWLHPDHNGDAWRSAFAHRVLSAWRDVSREALSQRMESAPAHARQANTRAQGANAARSQGDNRRLPWVPRPLPRKAGNAFVSNNQRPVRLALASTMMLLVSTIPAEARDEDRLVNALMQQASCACEGSP